MGTDIIILVPLPDLDSITIFPPMYSIRSRMLDNPKPTGCFSDSNIEVSNPIPSSSIIYPDIITFIIVAFMLFA